MLKRERGTWKFTAVLAVALLLTTPLLADLALAQSRGGNDYLQGKRDGEIDAEASGAWFFAGFCLGAVGVLIAYLAKPSPSTDHLMGESEQYIHGYIEGYKDKAASEQGTKALYGLGTACVIWGVIYAVIIAAASDDDF